MSHPRTFFTAASVSITALLLTGCGTPEDDAQPGAAQSPQPTQTETETVEPEPDGTEPNSDPGEATVDPVTVELFFTNTELGPAPEIFPVEREVDESEVLTATFEELVAGPTDEEEAEGYASFFSEETADLLLDAEVDSGEARIDFDASLSELIPNASTSTGSATLTGALDATATQFNTVDEVIYSLDGEVEDFYHWLQMSPPEDDASTSDDEDIQAPDDDFSLDPQTSANWDGFQTDVSYDVVQVLNEVRFGQHEGFERVVLEYSGPQELAYEVHYTEPATDVGASRQLLVTVLGANTGAAAEEQAYSGSAYPELDDTVFVEAQARTPESEVVIGLEEERPFRIHHAEDPARIIIDIAS